MTPARARDAAVADLALLGDVPPQLVQVLVVEIVADNVQFLGSRGDGDGGGGGGQQFVPAGASQSNAADFPSQPTGDDDIPF